MSVGQHAKREHDAFAETCASSAYGSTCLTTARRDTREPEARKFVLEESLDELVYGPMALDSLHGRFGCHGRRRAHHLPDRGYDEARAARARAEPPSLVVQALRLDDLLLSPLPNHLFTRDTSGLDLQRRPVNSMRKRARMRETIHYEAIYRWHPHFADSRSRCGRRARSMAPPPPRAATSSSSDAAPSSSV
jgi:arginine deiminase